MGEKKKKKKKMENNWIHGRKHGRRGRKKLPLNHICGTPLSASRAILYS